MTKYLLILFLAVITAQTSGQIITGQTTQTGCPGAPFMFTTTNLYAVNCTWQVSTDKGVTWTNITDDATYSSHGSSTLNIQIVDFSLSGNVYRMILASNPPTSGDTLVVVNAPPNPVFVSPVTSICQGSTIPFTVTGTAGIPLINDSIEWNYFNDSHFAYSPNNVYVSDTVILAHFSTSAASGNLQVYSIAGCVAVGSTSLPITINTLQSTPAGTAGGGADCATFSVMPGVATTYSDGTCSPIAAVTPSGSSPVSGSIQSCVTVDASVPTYNGIPYVSRYYNLEPTTNPSTSTATVTLYYTQADFDAYNAARGSFPALPTGPSDATGISNLTISQFHGTGTTPDTYVGGSGTITPGSVVWNSTASRWEVTFNITGFSGFFVSGSSIIPLPLTLTDFSGRAMPAGNLLSWTTAMEENTAYFAVQRAAGDGSGAAGGSGFQALAKVPAAGNSNLTLQYSYMDTLSGAAHPAYSYRLQMTDLDGKYTYSNIVTLQPLVSALRVSVSPNPFVQPVSLIVSTPAAGPAVLAVTDVNGRKLAEKVLVLQQGDNSLDPSLISNLHPGLYFIHVSMGTQQQTIKFVRE